jgi:uncharacterized membrane protein YphA (DoxX/SURF4 family)
MIDSLPSLMFNFGCELKKCKDEGNCNMSSQQKGSATTDLGLFFLRIMVGSFMLFGHGWGKLIGYSEKASQFADPIGLGPATSLGAAIFAEVFCSLLIILGIGTRIAAVPLVFTMFFTPFHLLPWLSLVADDSSSARGSRS